MPTKNTQMSKPKARKKVHMLNINKKGRKQGVLNKSYIR